MTAKRLSVFMGPLYIGARRVNLYYFEPAPQLVILSRAAKPEVKDLNQAGLAAYLLLSGAPGINSARPTLPAGKATDFNR